MAITPPFDPASFAEEHVLYEASMFSEARDIHLQGGRSRFESNLLIEACVLALQKPR